MLVRMMDAGMSCRWANPALLAFTGRSLEQTVGDGWLQDVHHEDHARCVLRQPTDRHAFDRVEYRLRRGTGEYGWVLETRSPRLASRGSVGGYLANMVDITEHKQAGTNLALQYAIAGVLSKAKTAQDAAEIVQLLCEGLGWDLGELWSVDTGAHTQHCSHRWVSPSIEGSGRLGALPGQVHAHRPMAPWQAGAPLWIADIAADETLAREPEARLLGLHGMLLLPVQVHGETYAEPAGLLQGVRQKNNAVAEVMLSAAVQLGGFLEHQRHLDRTRESEVRKAAMLDASLDAVITIDHQGQVVEFNSAAESIFGYRREQAVGRGIVDLIVPLPMRQQVLTGFAHYQATGESELLGKRFDALAMKADGSQFPVEVAMAPIGHGDPPFVTIYLCDASERKQAETDILSYRERLQALMSDLLLVEERERRRLAIDLHDGLARRSRWRGCKLAALRLPRKTRWPGRSSEIADLIEQANHTARSISFELSPPVLHDLGLEPALQWLVENIRDRYGLEIDLKHDSRPKPADERMRVILFRCHPRAPDQRGQARRGAPVQVRLEREHDHLNALVEDDGSAWSGLQRRPWASGCSASTSGCVTSAAACASSRRPGRVRRSPERAATCADNRHQRGREGMTIRVLFVDDHTMMREGLRALLTGQADSRSSARPATGAPRSISCAALADVVVWTSGCPR